MLQSEIRVNPTVVVVSDTKRADKPDQVSDSPIAYFRLYQARNTLDQIQGALRAYFEALNGSKPKDLEKASREYVASRTGNIARYKQDVETFYVSMKDRPPKTIQARLSHVKMFLLRNNIDFGPLFWKDLQRKIRGNRAVTVDSVPTNEELRNIISHMPIYGKALVLTAASSGARIGELLKLRIDDADLKKDPVRLTIRAEDAKGGGYRVTFASREAREAVQQWLGVRDQWLESAVKKSTFEDKKLKDPRLFPLTSPTVHEMYTRALEKSGYLKRDPRTGIATFHFHTLRKLFRTRLGPALNQDIIEALMGHESYLASAYKRYTIDQLAEFYRRAEPSLWVLSETGELAKDLTDTRELLSIQIARLTKENESLKAAIQQTVSRKEFEDLKADYEHRNAQLWNEMIMAGRFKPKDEKKEEARYLEQIRGRPRPSYHDMLLAQVRNKPVDPATPCFRCGKPGFHLGRKNVCRDCWAALGEQGEREELRRQDSGEDI